MNHIINLGVPRGIRLREHDDNGKTMRIENLRTDRLNVRRFCNKQVSIKSLAAYPNSRFQCIASMDAFALGCHKTMMEVSQRILRDPSDHVQLIVPYIEWCVDFHVEPFRLQQHLWLKDLRKTQSWETRYAPTIGDTMNVHYLQSVGGGSTWNFGNKKRIEFSVYDKGAQRKTKSRSCDEDRCITRVEVRKGRDELEEIRLTQLADWLRQHDPFDRVMWLAPPEDEMNVPCSTLTGLAYHGLKSISQQMRLPYVALLTHLKRNYKWFGTSAMWALKTFNQPQCIPPLLKLYRQSAARFLDGTCDMPLSTIVWELTGEKAFELPYVPARSLLSLHDIEVYQ